MARTERITAPDGRVRVQYLEDDAELGIAAGSQLLLDEVHERVRAASGREVVTEERREVAGHRARVARLLAAGVPATVTHARGSCSCGWASDVRHPSTKIGDAGHRLARRDADAHVMDPGAHQ